MKAWTTWITEARELGMRGVHGPLNPYYLTSPHRRGCILPSQLLRSLELCRCESGSGNITV